MKNMPRGVEPILLVCSNSTRGDHSGNGAFFSFPVEFAQQGKLGATKLKHPGDSMQIK